MSSCRAGRTLCVSPTTRSTGRRRAPLSAPCLGRGERVQLHAEQVDPEVPVQGDPHEPLADADEGGRLRNRVGAKL
jgi:hypothetical protein